MRVFYGVKIMPIPSPADFRNRNKKHSEVRDMLAELAGSVEDKDVVRRFIGENALIKTSQTKVHNKNNIARKVGRYFSTVEGFYDPTATGMCTELIPINPNFDVYVTGISQYSEYGGMYWFDKNGQVIVATNRRNVTGLAEQAVYIPANAAYLGLNTNITTTDEVNFVVTQTIDELSETLSKPVTFRRKKFYSEKNVELIAGSYYQSGVVAGGFHVRIPIEFGEKAVKITRPEVENKTLYMESGNLSLVNSGTNPVPTASNTLNKAYIVLNVAPQSVTDVLQVKFSLYTVVDELHVVKPTQPTDVVYEMSTQNYMLHPGRITKVGANAPIYEYIPEYRLTSPVSFNSDYPVTIQTDDTESGVISFFDDNYSIVGTLTKIGNATIAPEEIPTGAKYISKNLLTDKYATFIMTAGGEPKTTPQVDTILSLPPLIPVAVGVQMNLYYDNFRANPVNSTAELFMYEGNKPASNLTNPFIYSTFQTERALQWTPTTEGLTETITAEIRELNSYVALNKRTFDLISVPNNNGAGRRKITMICGDSQIEPDSTLRKTSFAPYLKDLFEQQGDMNMLFAGTKNFPLTIYGETPAENRTVNCLAEGYGGMQVNWFYGSSSPFWNPAKSDIDFKNYMANLAASNTDFNANDEFDYFIFPMGVNDYANGVSTPDIISRIKVMQDLLWRDFPNCVFIVSMPTQGSKFWSMDARRKWNIEYYEALIQEFTKPEYSGKVVIAATGIWTDNIYGSRQVRPYREPYKRIVDAKNLLINKYVQEGMTLEQATSKVVDEYGLEVKERVLERWMDEYPMTTDIVHSSWISAAQQADCLYSTLRYLLDINN